MKVDHCEFPDDLLYDDDGLVWARLDPSGVVTVGITSLYAALIKRPSKVTAKPADIEIEKGRAIGTVESAHYFGPIRAPFSGVLLEVNPAVVRTPRILTGDVYGAGWFARIRARRPEEDRRALAPASAAAEALRRQIATLRVHCFAAVPDFDMHEIGIECAAVLAKLTELILRIEPGDVVHLVTDDPTAPIEMVRWSDQTGQPVIDSRKEGDLYHFLVRKAS
ncbi:MAG TPA: sulfurtransferase TusA family protein [Thermoplasmata archaeon]|nr:sulfurtransferase TusA family protein [Thermoplasmata archaeon]